MFVYADFKEQIKWDVLEVIKYLFAYAEFKEQIKWDVLEVIKYLLGTQEEYNCGIGKRLGAGINRKTL